MATLVELKVRRHTLKPPTTSPPPAARSLSAHLPGWLRQVELRTFERTFQAREGRMPTKADLSPQERQLYDLYSQRKKENEKENASLREAGGKLPAASQPAASPMPQPPPPPASLPKTSVVTARTGPVPRLRFGSARALRTGPMPQRRDSNGNEVAAANAAASAAATAAATKALPASGWASWGASGAAAAARTAAAAPAATHVALPPTGGTAAMGTAACGATEPSSANGLGLGPLTAEPSRAAPSCAPVCAPTPPASGPASTTRPRAGQLLGRGALGAAQLELDAGAAPTGSVWGSASAGQRLQQLEAEAEGAPAAHAASQYQQPQQPQQPQQYQPQQQQLYQPPPPQTAAHAAPSAPAAAAGSVWRQHQGQQQRWQQLEAEARAPDRAEAKADAPVNCCVELGCLCLEPGLRCGFAWRTQSAYEDARAKSVRENQDKLRALGLLGPEPLAEAPSGGGANEGLVGLRRENFDGATTSAAPRGGKRKAGGAGAAASASDADGGASGGGESSRGRGRGGKARAPAQNAVTGAGSNNFVKHSKSGTYAGRGGCRGKVAGATKSGSKRARFQAADKRMKRRKGSAADAPTPQGVGELETSGQASSSRMNNAAPTPAVVAAAAAARSDPSAEQQLLLSDASLLSFREQLLAAEELEEQHLKQLLAAPEEQLLAAPHAPAAPAPADDTTDEALMAHMDRVEAPPAAQAESDAPPGAADAVGGLLLRTLQGVFGMQAFRPGQEAAIRRVLARRSTLLVLPTGGGKSLTYQLPAFLSTQAMHRHTTHPEEGGVPPARLPHTSPTPPSHLPHTSPTPPSHLPHTSLTPPSHLPHTSQLNLVVSPLIALIEDQLHSLPPALGGAMVSAAQSPSERMAALDALRARDAHGAAATRVLFVAPERLSNQRFQQQLRALPPVAGCRCGAPSAAAAAAALAGGLGADGARCAACGAAALPPLGFACVDEAHCVSEWSHNFRPTYMAVGAVLRTLGVDTVLGLTATATARTVVSIRACLQLPAHAVMRCDVRRENLTLRAEVVAADGRNTRLLQLLQRALPAGGRGAAIVYCNARYQTEQVATELQSRGWRADFYHAGRTTDERRCAHTTRPHTHTHTAPTLQ